MIYNINVLQFFTLRRTTVMSKIWEFFDTMEELVYVTDMDSHDLVYMNKKALQTYGFHSLDEIASKML